MVDDIRIVPERDEIRPGGQKKRLANKKPGSSRPQPAPKSGGSSALLFVLCIMVILVSGAAAYLYLQTQTLNEQRADLDERVKVLESKLSVTDESLSESGAAIQSVLRQHGEDLELHISEIRKLWAIAYDTNRIKIQEIEKTQANHSARINSARDALAKVESLSANFNTLKSQVNTTANQSLAVSATLDDVEASLRELSDLVAAINTDFGVQKRSVAEHQEAIDAIDQYRIQINQRVLRLEGELRATP